MSTPTLRNKIYYRIKPLVPWPVRVGLRRLFARRQRALSKDTWPVMPGSEKAPPNWPGWPDGKKFALVLTHDVEGPEGPAKCRRLMELEMKLGFRSSFNFIPEGDCEVPRPLLDELKSNGFEIGVHDLNHDGKLYDGRKDFAKKAARINKYLKDWGAVGFRSGFMLHNLEWQHDLEVTYDTSTFDTDPFEPQPDGVNTIFPFWVPRGHGSGSPPARRPVAGTSGYVELPYTLPQDSTLFLLLRERQPDIWFQKLDWVARHGGMGLLATHPGLMDFQGRITNDREYPHVFYRDFLDYLERRFKGQYWHATPAEAAEWYSSVVRPEDRRGDHVPPDETGLKGKKAAVVMFSFYPSDPRPRRETTALAHAGMEVDLICLRQHAGEPARETINGVNVLRASIPRRRDNKITYLLQYAAFVGFCASALAYRSLGKKYDIVHVHNMPDFLVFSGIGPKLRGARIVLDLHDPMPELMMTIFGLREDSFAVKLLKRIERLSIGFADHVLTVNLACKRIFSSRSCDPDKISVIMNTPDEEIFGFSQVVDTPEREPVRPFVMMYHGSIVERHGLDVAFRALELVRKTIPGAVIRIYGPRTPFLDSLLPAAQNNGLRDAVHYLGPKSLEEVATAIEECEVGIIPNRRSIFTEINTPTRIFEYLSRGKPVIAPSAPGILDYFGREDLVFFELGDAEDLARKIEYVYSHPHEVNAVVKRGQSIYLAHRWEHEKQQLLHILSSMLQPRRAPFKVNAE